MTFSIADYLSYSYEPSESELYKLIRSALVGKVPILMSLGAR